MSECMICSIPIEGEPAYEFMGGALCSQHCLRSAQYDAGTPSFFVTFGLSDQRWPNGAYACIHARTYEEARDKISAHSGKGWAFIYDIEDLERQVAAGWLPTGEVLEGHL